MHKVRHLIMFREVPERRKFDRTCPVDDDQTRQCVRSLRTCSTVETTGHVRSGRQQRPIKYKKVLEWRNYDRTLAATDQLIVALTVGTTGHVRSGRDQRPVSNIKLGFIPNGYFLSGAYK